METITEDQLAEHLEFLRVRGPSMKVRMDEYFRTLVEVLTHRPHVWSWEAAQRPVVSGQVAMSTVSDDYHRHPERNG